MTFKIETEVHKGPDLGFGNIPIDDNMNVDFSDYVRAERFHRQAKNEVWSVDDEATLDNYINGKAALLDGLFLAYPDLWTDLNENISECRACLRAGAATKSATADTGPAEPGNSLGIMF